MAVGTEKMYNLSEGLTTEKTQALAEIA